MTAHVIHAVICPVCDGSGLIVECANDGKAGCSHTRDREWTCPACDGTGQVDAGRLADLCIRPVAS